MSALDTRIRPFLEALWDEAPEGWGAAELDLLLGRHPELGTELHQLGRPEARHRYDGPSLEGLYALSRLVDLVTAPHQPGDEPTGWPAAATTAWADLRAMIGAVDVAEDAFHPFFHEIVEVQRSDDPEEPVTVVAEQWPGALVGALVLARAGVTVRAGSAVLDPLVAARSVQYWTWWRRNRPVADLSHGWGSNSQWATDFRRDYVVGDELHYNVDASPEDGVPEHDPDLTGPQKLELLRFRHGTLVDLGSQRWPYDLTTVEPRSQ